MLSCRVYTLNKKKTLKPIILILIDSSSAGVETTTLTDPRVLRLCLVLPQLRHRREKAHTLAWLYGQIHISYKCSGSYYKSSFRMIWCPLNTLIYSTKACPLMVERTGVYRPHPPPAMGGGETPPVLRLNPPIRRRGCESSSPPCLPEPPELPCLPIPGSNIVWKNSWIKAMIPQKKSKIMVGSVQDLLCWREPLDDI